MTSVTVDSELASITQVTAFAVASRVSNLQVLTKIWPSQAPSSGLGNICGFWFGWPPLALKKVWILESGTMPYLPSGTFPSRTLPAKMATNSS